MYIILLPLSEGHHPSMHNVCEDEIFMKINSILFRQNEFEKL